MSICWIVFEFVSDGANLFHDISYIQSYKKFVGWVFIVKPSAYTHTK